MVGKKPVPGEGVPKALLGLIRVIEVVVGA